MSSNDQDAYPQGGSLTDMADKGTTIPEDAAKQRLIPSKPRPGEAIDTSEDPNDLGAYDQASAATNAGDISRVSPLPTQTTLSLHHLMALLPCNLDRKIIRIELILRSDFSRPKTKRPMKSSPALATPSPPKSIKNVCIM